MSFTSNSNTFVDDQGNIYHRSFETIATSIQNTQQKITAGDGIGLDQFGYSVAVGCGRIVIGADGDDETYTSQGSVYIYNLTGTQIAKIVAFTPSTSSNFGVSVGIANDKIIVGANFDDVGANSNQGAAYIYDLNGTYINKITSPDGLTNDYFGTSVAIGSNRIVVGAYAHNVSANADQGAAYIFTTTGTYITKIVASDGAANDQFGLSVAVNLGKIVVGAWQDDSAKGSAYIYDLTGVQLRKITASDGAAGDQFGVSVAIGSGRIVVGANDPTSSGSAYIYDLNGTQLAKVTAPDPETGSEFGRSVAVGSGRIIIGSRYDDVSGLTAKGSLYIFDLNGNYIDKITASDGEAGDHFGSSVAICSGRIVSGVSRHQSFKGAAYVYKLPETHEIYFEKLLETFKYS